MMPEFPPSKASSSTVPGFYDPWKDELSHGTKQGLHCFYQCYFVTSDMTSSLGYEQHWEVVLAGAHWRRIATLSTKDGRNALMILIFLRKIDILKVEKSNF